MNNLLCLLFFVGLTSGLKPTGNYGNKLKPVGNERKSRALSRDILPWDYCSRKNRCHHGQGDCDRNYDCLPGLRCGRNNCRNFNVNALPWQDCCYGGDKYLYISDTMILNLKTWTKIDCDQQFPPGGSLTGATAGLVLYRGKMEVMVCGGGNYRRGCQVWTKNGWETFPNNNFERWGSASSTLSRGRMLITGGVELNVPLTGNYPYIYYVPEGTPGGGWYNLPPRDQNAGAVTESRECQVTILDTIYTIDGYRIYKTKSSIFPGLVWRELAPLNTRRESHACVVWNGKILAIGGFWTTNPLGCNDCFQSSIESYDPITNKWSYITPLPAPMSDVRAVVHQNNLYIMYGQVFGGYNNDVYKLKYGSTQWELVPQARATDVRREINNAVVFYNLHCK